MKNTWKKTTAFICALALTTTMAFNACVLPAFAEEVVTAQTLSETGELTQEQIEKNIIGTWILAEKGGKPTLTNDKPVLKIVSPDEAYSSISLENGSISPWRPPLQCGFEMYGNIFSVTVQTEKGWTIEHQFTVTEISSDRFTANIKSIFPLSESETTVTEDVLTFVKVDDFSEAVLGTWEGKCTSESSVFDDGKEHRWEYKADGTYVYYNKVGDEWAASDNTENEYFVAGNLLCTRWVENGVENREWWEISIEDGRMSWTALRADEDGSAYTATFEMNKVEENSGEVTQADIEEKLIGSWIIADRSGQPALTNEKIVITFDSTAKAHVSGSYNARPELGKQWMDMTEAEVEISGNKVTITRKAAEETSIVNELTITNITDTETQGDLVIKSISNGEERVITEEPIRFVKVNDDLSEEILGTWEGHCTSEGSAFDDGKEHRWEYKADGTYVYYNKVGDEWVASDNTLNEYFVSGDLLCMRWVENGVENREWWEISIEDGRMSWTALRADEDGSTYTTSFEMNKVEESSGKPSQEQTDDTNDVNPETGVSCVHIAVAGVTALMALTGAALGKKRKKENEEF